ncbi:MAG: ABC transporter substrate-binding protein [Lautropia sp.]|nr:ABC transporter substrate-binding protein [Lautropia sp.]
MIRRITRTGAQAPTNEGLQTFAALGRRHVCQGPASRLASIRGAIGVLLWLLLPVIGLPAAAETLRWAGQSDVQTLDPHAQNHPQTQAVLQQVYEGLTRYSPELEVEPALAQRWTALNALTWRFHLRRDVRFHDGSPLSADDVVFSLERLKEANSPMSALLNGVRSIKQLDGFTVEIQLDKPLPLLPRYLADARILNRQWARRHKSLKAQNLKIHEDSYASRHANGTGPFRIESWIPSQQLLMKRNEAWWDEAGFPGNVSVLIYLPISGDRSRIDALRRNEIDLVADLPLQRIPALTQQGELRVLTEASQRTLMIGMDQFSDQLRHAQAGKSNPFKDVRVRRALALAIDQRRLYRATQTLSRPAGTIVAPGIEGWSATLGMRTARNLPLARQLLVKAGYPKGFEVTLDCPNNRYAFDQEICHALVPMWRQIGVRLKVNTIPFASLVPKLETLDSSMWLIGWSSPDYDALQSLVPLVYTRSGKLDGAYNAGRVSNPSLDRLIDQARVDNDPDKRLRFLQDALQIVKDEYYYLPLRHPMRAWVMNRRLNLLSPPMERPEMRFVKVRASAG